jgi:hypothetical protein
MVDFIVRIAIVLAIARDMRSAYDECGASGGGGMAGSLGTSWYSHHRRAGPLLYRAMRRDRRRRVVAMHFRAWPTRG